MVLLRGLPAHARPVAAMTLREPWGVFETMWRECDMCGEGEMWARFGATDRAHHACEHHRWVTVLPCDDHEDGD